MGNRLCRIFKWCCCGWTFETLGTKCWTHSPTFWNVVISRVKKWCNIQGPPFEKKHNFDVLWVFGTYIIENIFSLRTYTLAIQRRSQKFDIFSNVLKKDQIQNFVLLHTMCYIEWGIIPSFVCYSITVLFIKENRYPFNCSIMDDSKSSKIKLNCTVMPLMVIFILGWKLVSVA